MLLRAFQKRTINIAAFRDKTTPKICSLALAMKRTCKAKGIKLYINQDIKLFRRFCFDGVHLTSRQFDSIKRMRLLGDVVVSTHTIQELQRAKKLRSFAATYSPIFYTPNKGEPKGIYALRRVPKGMKIIALGGIVGKKEINKLKRYKLFGFASIRYFT